MTSEERISRPVMKRRCRALVPTVFLEDLLKANSRSRPWGLKSDLPQDAKIVALSDRMLHLLQFEATIESESFEEAEEPYPEIDIHYVNVESELVA